MQQWREKKQFKDLGAKDIKRECIFVFSKLLHKVRKRKSIYD